MFGALPQLFNSEKAVAVGALIIAATVLAATGSMSIDQWQSYTLALVGIYVAGKTVQGAVDAASTAKVEAAKEAGASGFLQDERVQEILHAIAANVTKGNASPPAAGVGEVKSEPTP